MEQKLKDLHDEYYAIQYLKNWLIEKIGSYSNTTPIERYLKKEYKKECDKQIKVRKQIEELCK